MTSLGLIEQIIPKGSFFDHTQYTKIFGDRPAGQLLMPFVLFGELAGIEEIEKECLEGTTGEEVQIGDDRYLLLAEVAEPVWRGLPLETHQITLPSDEQQAELTKALQHLANAYPEGYRFVQEFVKVIAWTQLRDDLKGRAVEITSSSFPFLPLCIFISSRAQHHIPPNTLSSESSYRFLAENLYHEAIHQAVNMNLLLFDLLNEDFESETSPKITIPWRANNIERNQAWEIDRTFHATVVYGYLLGYRMAELRDPTLLPFERESFLDATVNGIKSVKYLSQALLEYEQHFTAQGVEVLRSLARSVEMMASEAEKELNLQHL